jgi:hypothetical protein
MILGAGIVIGLVGYGVVTPDQIQTAGSKVRQGVNYVMSKGQEATKDPKFTFEGIEMPKIITEEIK